MAIDTVLVGAYVAIVNDDAYTLTKKGSIGIIKSSWNLNRINVRFVKIVDSLGNEQQFSGNEHIYNIHTHDVVYLENYQDQIAKIKQQEILTVIHTLHYRQKFFIENRDKLPEWQKYEITS